MADSDRLTFTASRFRMAATGGFCFLVMLVGLWFIGESDDAAVIGWSWIGVMVLGLGCVAGVWQTARPSQLIVSPEGFQVTGLFGNGLIPWRDVDAFFVHAEAVSDKGHGEVAPHAAWRLGQTAKARNSLLSRISRAGLEGEVDGAVPRHFGSSPEEMADLLESWRVRYS